MDVDDATILQQWSGTTRSFVTMLRDRYARADAPACDRYRSLAD